MALQVRLDHDVEDVVSEEVARLKRDARVTVSAAAVANGLIREALEWRSRSRKAAKS